MTSNSVFLCTDLPQDDDIVPPPSDGFVPYRSALTDFRTYRRADVDVHKQAIDPQTPWCQFEAAGGVCNDPTCHDQHFGR